MIRFRRITIHSLFPFFIKAGFLLPPGLDKLFITGGKMMYQG